MALREPLRHGNQQIIHLDKETFPIDTRGVIWLTEEPQRNAQYTVGVDCAVGIQGWSRFARTEDDEDIDNSAVVVMRVGYGQPGDERFRPDIQVAGWTAPVDPDETARVVNILGRTFSGRNEDNQAPVIIEVYPGPGGQCQKTLQDAYGYTNLYREQSLDAARTSQRKYAFGWYSDAQSMPQLWTKGLKWIHNRGAVFKDPSLIEEFADCRFDVFKLRGAAKHGFHDDRVTAALLALWAARRWSFHQVEVDTRPADKGPVSNWQQRDVSSEKMYSEWNDLISGWGDGL